MKKTLLLLILLASSCNAINVSNGNSAVLRDVSGNLISVLTDSAGLNHLGVGVIQDVLRSINNNSTKNIASGEIITCNAEADLNVAGIQVNFKTDVNCLIYIEQSDDAINWDISDSYTYYSLSDNFSRTVQATSGYFRIRIQNIDVKTSSFLRLATYLCPIVEALPRSLDSDGYLKVAPSLISDVETGHKVAIDKFRSLKVAESSTLLGSVFVNNYKDTNFWQEATSNGGTVTASSGQIILSTNGSTNASSKYNTVHVARFVPYISHNFAVLIKTSDLGATNNIRRWGAYDLNNGLFFELNGTTLNIVSRKSGVDTKVSQSNWNVANNFKFNTNYHIYEIWFTYGEMLFFIDQTLIHKLTITDTLYSQNYSLPITFENINTSNANANVNISCPISNITRIGKFDSSPISIYQSGTIAERVLKYGTGLLHSMVISGVSNASVITLYDNTAASGTIIFSTGTMGPQTTPFSLDLTGAKFTNGLTLAITGANSNTTIIYE